MIEATNLSFSIGDKAILTDVSIEIPYGEVLSILGPNGAGKTSLLKCLTGAEKPIAGDVLLDGQPLQHYPPSQLAKRRAVLSQSIEVSFPFTVEEIVLMGRNPHIQHSETKYDKEIASYILDMLEATHLADRLYSTLSGGEKQRVQFARILTQIWDQENACLFLDEPTAALDLKHQISILEIAKELASSRGFAICAILHDLKLAKIFSDKLILMKSGKVFVKYDHSDALKVEDICALMDVPETYTRQLI
ncbi:heme ABC transporter ATP-binding protein [Curvivirga sp.]|uniref:heme ABC transporter ATP-binding protein n=1 Tax=Curvivirga sp. TaxID=2856848 RepID=UPI003B5C7258